jgi:hypothetical protein
MIAFFSDSKTVIIHINRFGEQFIDILALIIIWIICIVGLIILFIILKEGKEQRKSSFNYDKEPLITQNNPFFDTNKDVHVKIYERGTTGVVAESSKSIDQELILED